MKQFLFSLLFSFFGLVVAQDYSPMIQSDNEWKFHSVMPDMDSGDFYYKDYHVRFTDNTITLNDKLYWELEIRSRDRINDIATSDWTDWADAGILLSENIDEKKVYVYYEEGFAQHSLGEFLLYDFNLGIGDTVNLLGFVDGDTSEPVTITNITNESIYGVENVKTYHFEEMTGFNFRIYEGIGNTMGLFTATVMQDFGWELTDFGKNLSQGEVSSIISKIYPNPFTNQIQIASQKPIKQLELYDMTGKLIQSKTTLAELNSNVNSLKSGIYLLTITYSNNSKETFKLMKK